jgi:hypothetical protein
MPEFVPRSVVLKGRLTVAAPLARAFELFSPEGERLWVPGWDPEILYPPGAAWVEGLIFRTKEETGDAIWVVSRLDPFFHRVTYHRVEPGRYVARITVQCDPGLPNSTNVTTTYTFTGLSPSGNEEIARLTQDSYDAKMARWSAWIGASLNLEG